MDKTIKCMDCGQEFVFTESEQDFYAEKGFTDPKRCASCRAIKKAQRESSGGGDGGYSASGGYSSGGGYSDRSSGSMYGDPARSYGGGGGYSSGPREMFTATCSQCGNEARVPFKPSGAKPVYCSDCFRAQRG